VVLLKDYIILLNVSGMFKHMPWWLSLIKVQL